MTGTRPRWKAIYGTDVYPVVGRNPGDKKQNQDKQRIIKESR